MLQAIDIWFRYGRHHPWVLGGATLEVGPGEVVGLRGLSGAGKTTLARILAGYLKPSSGRVLVDEASVLERGYRKVQLLFQHPELTFNPHFRIAKALEEAGGDGAMAESLGLRKSWLSRFPHELSGGELQRVALARALGPKTRYLIADEMTAMLDAIAQAEVWMLLSRIVEMRGVGLVVISHDDALLSRVAQRAVELRPLARRSMGP
jgi:peptide/nickel transport system ATP-binding protein